ncbi:restriction endonuclease subunit S [uncultured Shewanella sp.]|uniref:restriction endonuclease subunit S n=1 Tax=uncultured Shewanella sp. TaxID=173975 RepID=UPI0026278FF2|nr:restriction endonuclease subunit S [uncultured Shewanella sp.]
MSNRGETTLKGKIKIKHGFAFKSEFFTSEETPYIVLTPGNFYEQGGFKRQRGKEKYYSGEIPDGYLHKKGDLIVAMTEQAAGLLGSCARIPESDTYLHNQRLGLITTDSKKILSGYVYHLFKTDYVRKQIQLTSSGSKVKHTSPDRIYDVKVPLPDVTEQEKIVGLLDLIEGKIALNTRINSELEAMTKTLYDYWFVQFDFPDVNGKPYKASGGKMAFNKSLKREIPDGWDVNSISDWIKADKTGDWGKETSQGNYTLQVDCIRGADINGLNGLGKIAAPNRFILKKNAHKLLLPFDFIIEISGGSPTQSTGRLSGITKEVLERFDHAVICSNFCKAISLKNNSYFYNFSYMWQWIYDHEILFGWEGKTSGIKNLLFDSFVTKYSVAMPPEDLAQKFYDFVGPLQSKKQTLLKENSELEALRNWLLPMLMNGQVTVK